MLLFTIFTNLILPIIQYLIETPQTLPLLQNLRNSINKTENNFTSNCLNKKLNFTWQYNETSVTSRQLNFVATFLNTSCLSEIELEDIFDRSLNETQKTHSLEFLENVLIPFDEANLAIIKNLSEAYYERYSRHDETLDTIVLDHDQTVIINAEKAMEALGIEVCAGEFYKYEIMTKYLIEYLLAKPASEEEIKITKKEFVYVVPRFAHMIVKCSIHNLWWNTQWKFNSDAKGTEVIGNVAGSAVGYLYLFMEDYKDENDRESTQDSKDFN